MLVRLLLLAVVVPGLAGSALARDSHQTGMAAIYSYSGGKTASGERSDPQGFTAAHRTLPFGTRVRVINMKNGKTIVVRINDRGPFNHGRIIDLTPAAARELGFSGLTRVSVETLER